MPAATGPLTTGPLTTGPLTTGPDAAGTIAALLERRAAEHPGRVALIGNDGTGSYQRLTFGELLSLSRAAGGLLAQALAAGGGRGQQRVAWVYGNSNSLVALVLYHAICSIGAVNVPVNPGSTPAEAAELADRAGAGVLVAAAPVLDAIPAGRARRVAIDGLDSLRATLAGRPPAGSWPGASADQPSVILFTSGTTGRSKGVVHSHRTALAAGGGWRAAFGLDDSDVYQSMFPVYSGAGLHFSGLACLLAGATYLVDEPRPTSQSLSRIAAAGSTVYAAVPSVYQYWLAEDRSPYDLSSLRLLDFGGSVMHRSTIEALREALPGVDLVQTYGLTEAGPGGLYLPPALLDARLGSIGSVGSGGLRFRVDPKAAGEHGGDERAGGVVGELQLAGPSVMLGYLDDADSTARVFDGEWMRTGDIVRLDGDGFVYFLDRLKDLIIRGGFNISSIEVEEVFLASPAVRQAAAFGVPHPSLGEVVAVAVVPAGDGGIDLGALREYAARRLPRVMVPAWVLVLDELPLSAAGKVLKRALRDDPRLAPWKG